MSFLIWKTSIHLQNTNYNIFHEIWELLTLHRQQCNNFKTQKGSNDILNSPCDISGSTVILWSFLSAKNAKITSLFNNFGSFLGLFCFLCRQKVFSKLHIINVEPLMDYFNDVLTTFLCLKHGSFVAVYAGSERFNQIFEFVFRWWTEVLWVWNDMRVTNYCQMFISG